MPEQRPRITLEWLTREQQKRLVQLENQLQLSLQNKDSAQNALLLEELGQVFGNRRQSDYSFFARLVKALEKKNWSLGHLQVAVSARLSTEEVEYQLDMTNFCFTQDQGAEAMKIVWAISQELGVDMMTPWLEEQLLRLEYTCGSL